MGVHAHLNILQTFAPGILDLHVGGGHMRFAVTVVGRTAWLLQELLHRNLDTGRIENTSQPCISHAHAKRNDGANYGPKELPTGRFLGSFGHGDTQVALKRPASAVRFRPWPPLISIT